MNDKKLPDREPAGTSKGGQFKSDGNGQPDSGKTIAAIRKFSSEPERDIQNADLTNKKWDNMSATELSKMLQRELSTDKNIVKVNLDSEIQKQFDNATPKERSKIAFDYIMKNLRGKYSTSDNIEVRIERVGAKEISHTLFEPKIRVSPELGRLIKNGRLIDLRNADHGIFKKFAYYEARIGIGNDIYTAVLNIGIRANGESTLYDINQFKKQ